MPGALAALRCAPLRALLRAFHRVAPLCLAVLCAAALTAAPAARARPLGCEQNYPIAGTAGFANAQAARKTNVNTYSAAAFAERVAHRSGLAGQLPVRQQPVQGFLSGEMNDTFGAARVPTWCGDTKADAETDLTFLDEEARLARKERVYEQPLDLYAFNVVFGVGGRGVGAFYSASVTQSVLGYRLWAVPAQIINTYPAFFAPLVGNFQRGDGVASYAVDWIGGGYINTRFVGARVGYTGARGFFGSVDERTVGLFGTISTTLGAGSDGFGRDEALAYLRAGVQDLSLRRFGADKLGAAVGMTSVYMRDLPTGIEVVGGGEAVRLRTLHVEQKSIADMIEAAASVRTGADKGLFDAHLGWHTPGFYVHRGEEGPPSDRPRFAGRLGLVSLPPRYTQGVDGGRFFSARLQLYKGVGSLQVLFNDPEQLALYPFATNALSVRVGMDLVAGDQ